MSGVNHHFDVENFCSEYPDLVAAKLNCTNSALFLCVLVGYFIKTTYSNQIRILFLETLTGYLEG